MTGTLYQDFYMEENLEPQSGKGSTFVRQTDWRRACRIDLMRGDRAGRRWLSAPMLLICALFCFDWNNYTFSSGRLAGAAI